MEGINKMIKKEWSAPKMVKLDISGTKAYTPNKKPGTEHYDESHGGKRCHGPGYASFCN